MRALTTYVWYEQNPSKGGGSPTTFRPMGLLLNQQLQHRINWLLRCLVTQECLSNDKIWPNELMDSTISWSYFVLTKAFLGHQPAQKSVYLCCILITAEEDSQIKHSASFVLCLMYLLQCKHLLSSLSCVCLANAFTHVLYMQPC